MYFGVTFKFSKISYMDSSIPTIVEYSCGTFLNLARVIHVPSISPSKALCIFLLEPNEMKFSYTVLEGGVRPRQADQILTAGTVTMSS